MEEKNKELLLKKIDELIEIIKNGKEYKRYVELGSKMKENKEIMNLISKIKKEEQIIVKKEYRKEDTSSLNEELNKIKKELNSFPIYQEYTYLQQDLNNTFQTIKSIIEKSFEKINS